MGNRRVQTFPDLLKWDSRAVQGALLSPVCRKSMNSSQISLAAIEQKARQRATNH